MTFYSIATGISSDPDSIDDVIGPDDDVIDYACVTAQANDLNLMSLSIILLIKPLSFLEDWLQITQISPDLTMPAI